MGESEEILVPFRDGDLDFDCRSCRAGCCRSGNLILGPGEDRELIGRYPGLRFFHDSRAGAAHHLKKYRSCWFLEDGENCAIQKSLGYAAKPFICRLHPFYVHPRPGGFVVLPDRHCPVFAAGGSGAVRGDLLLENAREAVRLGAVRADLGLSGDRWDLESRVYAASADFRNERDYLGFAAAQAALAESGRIGLASALRRKLEIWHSFLDLEKAPPEDPETARGLAVWTPVLRLGHPLLRDMDGREVPAALLALGLYLRLFFGVRGGAPGPLHLQTCHDLLGDYAIGLALVNEKTGAAFKGRPLEDRIAHLRALGEIGARRRTSGRT